MLPIVNNVRAEREARGMTQSELGAAIGLTRQTVAAIEQRRYSPSLEAAFRIAHVFGKRVDDVFHWQPDVESVALAELPAGTVPLLS